MAKKLKTIAKPKSLQDVRAEGVANLKRRDRVRPKTEGQREYLQALRSSTITVCDGPAGCGKTFLACAVAVDLLQLGQIERIVLTRPAVEAGEKLGYLPGDLAEKINPYLRPLFDSLGDLLDPETAKMAFEAGIIEVAPLAYMRGRTFRNAYVVLDEAQNATPDQVRMFLTRIGEGSRFVICGDSKQSDLPKPKPNGLLDLCGRMKAHVSDICNPLGHDLETQDKISKVTLTRQDIVRHPIIQTIESWYENDKTRT
ncbi:MAG: PhoH family protein [Hyphomicrobiaceae bacterium]|nr:MAG: PhoH family protein [Hyphomicrobiaceae bacterium]